MNDKDLEELRYYFTGYGSKHDEIILKLIEQFKRYREALEPIPAEEWHDDDGHVVWWRLPVEEPPYVGSPLCDDFTFGYYTHYTKLICPLEGDPHESS